MQRIDAKLPRDRWLLGGEWDHDRTFGGQLPTAELLDKYVADRPVFLRRYDGHMAIVNTKVLKLANITAQTPERAAQAARALARSIAMVESRGDSEPALVSLA